MDKLFEDFAELFGGLGVFFSACVRFAVRALVYVLKLCKQGFVFGVDLLHYFGIAAAVGVMLEYESFVLLLEFFEGLRVVEVFHFVVSFRVSVLGGCPVLWLHYSIDTATRQDGILHKVSGRFLCKLRIDGYALSVV